MEQLQRVMAPGAPCGVAPGWSVCFPSLFLSMYAIHIPINFKPTLYVEPAPLDMQVPPPYTDLSCNPRIP